MFFFKKRKQKKKAKIKTEKKQTNKKTEQVLGEHVEVHALIELQFFILL